MRYSRLILVLTLTLIFSEMHAQNLEAYQWKNRILVLVDQKKDTKALRSQLNVLKSEKAQLAERDLVIFSIAGDKVYNSDGGLTEMNSKKALQRLGVSTDFIGTLLIGKDGGVKLREKFEVLPETIFTLIDGMPMRRAEMRKQR